MAWLLVQGCSASWVTVIVAAIICRWSTRGHLSIEHHVNYFQSIIAFGQVITKHWIINSRSRLVFLFCIFSLIVNKGPRASFFFPLMMCINCFILGNCLKHEWETSVVVSSEIVIISYSKWGEKSGILKFQVWKSQGILFFPGLYRPCMILLRLFLETWEMNLYFFCWTAMLQLKQNEIVTNWQNIQQKKQ